MYSIAMPNRDKYKVGLVQMSMGTDLDANLQKAVQFVEEAAGGAAVDFVRRDMMKAFAFDGVSPDGAA